MRAKAIRSRRSKNFNSKLAAYSATAGAALLAAPAANAVIQTITTGGSFTFSYTGSPHFTTQDFAAGIAASLYFWGRQSFKPTAGPFAGKYFNEIGVGAHAAGADLLAVTAFVQWPYLVNFAKSAPVAAGVFAKGGGNGVNTNAPVAFSNYAHGTLAATGTVPFGLFRPAGLNTPATGYVGFKHINGGQTYYGWLRISVTQDAQGWPATISLVDKNGDGVYGAFGLKTDHISAGQIAPAPEPSITAIGGLGLLALGAAGVRELRRRKQGKI